jgi:hypothetical protein
MKNLLARSLRYFQIPGSPFLGFSEKDLHDRAYQFWTDFWKGVLQANGTDKKPNPDDFLRQHVVGVIEHRGAVVALHAHSFFDLSHLGPREHSYFSRFYTKEYLEALAAQNVHRVMSMEMYSVLPKWRSPQLGVSLASVMIALGIKLAQSWNVDAAIGVARVDAGVDKLVQEQGAVVLGPEIQIYNTPCKQIAFFPPAMRAHHKPEVSELVDHFWKNRTDVTQPFADVGLKKAA